MDEYKIIQRDKTIITVAVLVLVFSSVAYILLNSSLNDTIYFHYIYNQNTGKPIGVIACILLYLLFGFVIGVIPFSITFLFSMFVYFFLHRKDKKLFHSDYHPKYEEEFYYGGHVALFATYGSVFLLLFLHVSNIATIQIF